jgi:hypothetical protein
MDSRFIVDIQSRKDRARIGEPVQLTAKNFAHF